MFFIEPERFFPGRSHWRQLDHAAIAKEFGESFGRLKLARGGTLR